MKDSVLDAAIAPPSYNKDEQGAVNAAEQYSLDLPDAGISIRADPPPPLKNYFKLHNRRYLGNKHKLLGFIADIIEEKCGKLESFCDIFAGTGVVASKFNRPHTKIIANDLLRSNYSCLSAFLASADDVRAIITEKIKYLNSFSADDDNYFSVNFGGTYFSHENARKIGALRAEIEKIAENENEKNILICSLIYAADKVANTVGHYDAYRKELDSVQPLKLLAPEIDYGSNHNNKVYNQDANALVRTISCDVLYIDPPYNSRQYSDAYHLLENLANWERPQVKGVAKKMDRAHLKSDYCLKSAPQAFADLIQNADCRYVILSYNNTGDSKDGRSNARINDDEILQTLNKKGEVEVFEKKYKAFTTGRSNGANNAERIFLCKVKN